MSLYMFKLDLPEDLKDIAYSVNKFFVFDYYAEDDEEFRFVSSNEVLTGDYTFALYIRVAKKYNEKKEYVGYEITQCWMDVMDEYEDLLDNWTCNSLYACMFKFDKWLSKYFNDLLRRIGIIK